MFISFSLFMIRWVLEFVFYYQNGRHPIGQFYQSVVKFLVLTFLHTLLSSKDNVLCECVTHPGGLSVRVQLLCPVEVQTGFKGVKRGGLNNWNWKFIPVFNTSKGERFEPQTRGATVFYQLKRMTSSYT